MASFRKIGRNWFYRFTDGDGKQRERKGCPDRRETEGMASAAEAEAANIRHGYIDPKSRAHRDHEARPLSEHLDDFRKAIIAKGGAANYASVTRNRAGRVIDLAGIRRVSDLCPSKALNALASLRNEGLGAETINHHIRAVKGFAAWLAKEGRAREHHLAHLSTKSPEADRRHRRRVLSPDEAARLIRAAERGPVVMGMAGPDRARLYALALGTGFRASELASLTPERFDLAGDPPTATVAACYTKNGREAVQPLPPALAGRLAPWLAARPAGRPVFTLTPRTAEMMRVDLRAAGIDYETPTGKADFHSLRGAYISNLVASGASVKTCQVLARHSDPGLTIGIYAKTSLHDIKGAVAALPDSSPEAPKFEAARMAATGTHGKHASNRPSLYFPFGGDGAGRDASDAGEMADATDGRSGGDSVVPQVVKKEGVDAPSRSLTGPVAGRSDGPGSALQIGLAEDLESLGVERDAGLLDVVDVQSHRRPAPGVDDQRVGVMDVNLGLDQSRAEVDQGMRAVGHLGDQQLVLGEGQLLELEDLPALLGVAEDHPDDAAVGRVGDREADDFDLRALEAPDQFEELADPVLQEDRELRHRRPVATLQRLVVDLAAPAFPEAHVGPRWSSTRIEGARK